MESLKNLINNVFFPSYCPLCGEKSKKFKIHNLCKRCLQTIIPLENDNTCKKCGCPLISEKDICLSCREDNTLRFDSCYSLFNYIDYGKELVHQYKFEGHKSLSYFFAEQINLHLKITQKRGCVIPVPASNKSLKRRGWDPVGTIAGILKKKYNYSVLFQLRRLPSKSQKELTKEDRLSNLYGKICIKSGFIPQDVLIIDDVFTTGTTVNECARVLKEWGCLRVEVITICRD